LAKLENRRQVNETECFKISVVLRTYRCPIMAIRMKSLVYNPEAGREKAVYA
jgi:hypothetical protein